MAYQSGWTPIVELQQGQEVSAKYDAAFHNVDLALADIESKLQTAYMQLTPQTTKPVGLTEGAVYYDLVTHSFTGINDIEGTGLNFGYEMNERVFNSTGVDIPEGVPLTVVDGLTNGALHVKPASADALENAVVIGYSTSVILDGAIGLMTTAGRVNDVDTKGIAQNKPVYLSTVAGEVVEVSPEISTAIGYVVQEQSAVDVTDGVLYILPRSIISLPNVVAFMNQDLAWTTPLTLNLNRVYISNYDELDAGKRIMPYDVIAGEISSPATGIYDASIDFDTSFTDIGNVVLHCLVEVLEDDRVGGLRQVAKYNKTISKNSTTVNGSMTKTFNVVKDRDYSLTISCPDGTLSNFVLENVSFSMKSIDIR